MIQATLLLHYEPLCIIMSLSDTVETASGPVASGDVATAASALPVSLNNNIVPPSQVAPQPGSLTLVSTEPATDSGPTEAREAANLQREEPGVGLENAHTYQASSGSILLNISYHVGSE